MTERLTLHSGLVSLMYPGCAPRQVFQPKGGSWSITASASWPLWCLSHKLEVWEPHGLTFPSAPSSTPSRPMISFRLTAPADCLPPSSFKSLQGQAKDKDASVCTQRSHGDVYYWNTRVILTIMMEEVPQCLTGSSLCPSFGASW